MEFLPSSTFPDFKDATFEPISKDVSDLTFEEPEEQESVPTLPEHACQVIAKRGKREYVIYFVFCFLFFVFCFCFFFFFFFFF